MGICVEEMPYVRSKESFDHGTFTVQKPDVPMCMKKKGKVSWRKPRKPVRLTPIHESTEEIEEVSCNSRSRCCDSTSPMSYDKIHDVEDTYLVQAECHSDTRHTKVVPLVLDFLDEVEEELDDILESVDNYEPRDINDLETMPARPRCKLKVLPPSLTERDERSSIRRKKRLETLRRRCKSVNNINSTFNSPASSSLSMAPTTEKSNRTVTSKDEAIITDLLLERPVTAGTDVQVFQLSDLKTQRGNSVPDLPSLVKKIEKINDLRKAPRVTYDDSGALSTPRRAPEEPLGPVEWGVTSLRGTEMSSFYNMWERDQKQRPFERKDGQNKLKDIKVKRSCMCSVNASMKSSRTIKLKPLPPIRT